MTVCLSIYDRSASCDKAMCRRPLEKYGNGFKSGSMRLGRDVIVFTKSKETKSIGLLSPTYLAGIKKDTVLVPIVTWKRRSGTY